MFGIRTVLGLPVHALIVHFAVVLVPLAALALIATGWRTHWRRTYSFPVAILALAGAVSAFLAAQSGGTLRRSLRQTALSAGTRAKFGNHPGSGNSAEVAAFLFALAAVALWAVQRSSGKSLPSPPKWLQPAVYAIGSGLGLIAIATMIVAGHSGATLVWRDLGNYVSPK